MNKAKVPRLSDTETLIIGLLIESGQEMFGLEMVEAAGGKLKRGTIYVTLQRMADKGFVESREEPRQAPEIGMPRRRYWVSPLGQKIYAAREAYRRALS
jgi:DNA-binding PadR family transcriptional regulator